ncbi:MAG: hypothetical protein HOC23_03885 [Halieaceae bacterium]|jgi:Spy/CpxP family protein refolding chaperone|nr:hypothetical protein [Halieaceae bacterium]
MTSNVSSVKYLTAALAMFGLCFFSSVGAAEPPGSGAGPSSLGSEAPPHRGPEHLVEELELSDLQAESFLAVMHEQHEKRMAVHEQYSAAREEEHNALEELRGETLYRLESILEPDQLQKFEDLSERRGRRGKRHGPPTQG